MRCGGCAPLAAQPAGQLLIAFIDQLLVEDRAPRGTNGEFRLAGVARCRHYRASDSSRMRRPVPFSTLLLKPLEIALTWAAEKVADAVILPRLEDRAAQSELIAIIAESVEVVAQRAPTIAADLRSSAFINWVLAPALLDALRTRNRQLSAAYLAETYAGRFLRPYLRDRELSAALESHFHLHPDEFVSVFGALLSDLRPRLYASKHWREPIRDLALEEIRTGVLGLGAESIQPATARIETDAQWEAARKDALTASTDLRNWERRIEGLYLERPEFAALKDRVLSNPAAATLLIGPSGGGKSALLARLAESLENDGVAVFAIKADLIPREVMSLQDLSAALGMQGSLIEEIDTLASRAPVVVLIDQLDAVSEVMDRSSRRMSLLLQLANRWGAGAMRKHGPPVHVVVSSRPFEASHDARFKTLDAAPVELALPPFDAVAALLCELGLDPERVTGALRETLRRPFHLKLYVDIAKRGRPVDSLVEGELLNAWLASAQLGDDVGRAEVMGLLTALAEEMTATETLWRPADKFTASHPGAVRRAEACELIVRRGANLGFAHQTWLDDFQARGFLTAGALADQAWATQDALFGRATLLRGLERWRTLESEAYPAALDLLLGDPRTRRHLRHLVVDLVAVQAHPHPREIAWVQRLLREDPVLSRRAINKIVERWPSWRAALAPQIASVLRTPNMERVALVLSEAEAKHEAGAADRLIETLWADARWDDEVLEIAWRANHWSPTLRTRLRAILQRSKPADHWIAHFAAGLAEAGRAADAADMLALVLEHMDPHAQRHHEFHGLEKVWEAAPLEYAQAIMPWFLRLVAGAAKEERPVRNRYPSAYGLPYDWQEDANSGEVLAGLQKAVNAVARQDPQTFLALITPLKGIEIDEVQAVIAEGFAAAGQPLAETALQWLLRDPRRLHVGVTHAMDDDQVYGLVQGYSTGQLVAGIVPHLAPDGFASLQDAIERWDGYAPTAYEESTADDRRQMRRWSEEHRARLLDLLPPDALSSRRRRQVAETIRKDRLSLKVRRAGRTLAGFTRSRMSAEQMAAATDEQVFGMLDKFPDCGSADQQTRRQFLEGGPSELAHAFGAFAKIHPARAMALGRARFLKGRQERAAGVMVQELSGLDEVAPQDLLDLVREFIARGFDSADWRRNAGWALERIAHRRAGLDDADLQVLEAWLDTDSERVTDQIARRRANDQANRERNRPGGPRAATAMLFGRGLDGIRILPQHNYTFLSAIGSGLTCREPPAHEAWLETLERHAERPEDPAIWAALLRRHAWSLHHSDPTRVSRLLHTIHGRHPDAFDSDASHEVWRHRALFPPDLVTKIVISWIATGGAEGLQIAGEYAAALSLIEPNNREMATLVEVLQRNELEPARVGVMFGAAAVWREIEDDRRQSAHDILLGHAAGAEGQIAEAISSAVDMTRALPPDHLTAELLAAARDNNALLKACLNHRFIGALQDLLLHPGFEQLVLEVADRSTDLLLADEPRRLGSLVDQDMVGIAVALQRSAGPLRVQAMDLYEKLLDAGVYGADQTARASLQR